MSWRKTECHVYILDWINNWSLVSAVEFIFLNFCSSFRHPPRPCRPSFRPSAANRQKVVQKRVGGRMFPMQEALGTSLLWFSQVLMMSVVLEAALGLIFRLVSSCLQAELKNRTEPRRCRYKYVVECSYCGSLFEVYVRLGYETLSCVRSWLWL